MAPDPKKKARYEIEDEREDQLEEEEAEAVEVVPDPERPTCPRCGWHNTRLSHTKDMFDGILRTFSLRAFRCRSCGNRFRRFRRVPKV
jgi:transposase